MRLPRLTEAGGSPPIPGAVHEEPATVEHVGRSVGRGLRWSLGNNALSRAGTFLTGLVLARLLDPSDYGVFAVAVVAMVVISNVNDLGIEATLVRWPGAVDRIAPTAVTLIAAFSVLFAGAIVLGAPLFTGAMGVPDATGIVQLLALAIVINGLTAVPSGILTRTFRQDRRMAADMAGFVVGTGLTLGMALTGFGVWSLAWGRLAGNATTSGLHAVFAPSWLRPGWSSDAARALLAHGPPIAGTTLLTVAMLNADYLVVGRVVGVAALGFYLMAFNLSSWPVNMFSTAVEGVVLPGFARLQHDRAELRRTFLHWLVLLMLVSIPVSVVLATAAAPTIRVLYGDRWAPAAAALAGLAVLGLFRVAFHYVADLLMATGRGKSSLRLQAIWLAAVVPGLALGAHLDGIRGAAIAHVVVAVVIMLPLFVAALRWLGIRVGDLGTSLRRPLAAGVVAAGLALLARSVPGGSGTRGEFVRLAFVGAVAVAGYALVIAPLIAGLLRARNGTLEGEDMTPLSEAVT